MNPSSSSHQFSQGSHNPYVQRQADAIRQRTERRSGGYDRRSGGGSDRRSGGGSDRRSGGYDRRSGGYDRRSADTNKSVDTDTTVPRNVMELLIEGELERQLKRLSEAQRADIKIPQVTAYALNRLPSLYVTSAKGWRQQWVHGQSELQKDIETAVRRAILAVQRDPLRAMSPVGHCLPDVAEAPMAQLRLLLQDADLNWETLVPTVQRLLVEGKMNFPDEVKTKTGRNTSASSEQAGSGTSQPAGDKFDWNDHPLHQRGY